MFIIRRSNCFNTAPVIVFSVGDRPVCRLRRNFSTDGHFQRVLRITGAVLIQFDLLIELLETCRGLQ